MKSFKEVINEGGEMYPADDMTMQEVKIACYAAQNILDRLEKGAMIQRWQISAIVKAKEELASVYTSMSTDEEGDDEWEDDDYGDEEEQVYVGYEYPGMYGESVGGLFKNASEWESAAKSRGLVVKSMTHPSGETTKYQIAKDKQGNNRGHFDHGTKSGHLKEATILPTDFSDRPTPTPNKLAYKLDNQPKKKVSLSKAPWDVKKEEADFKVSVEGLPKMFVKAKSESDAKTKLRKVVKNPDMIKDVERVTSSDVKKTFRDFLSGKKAVEEETDLEEADGTKRNRELLATGRISKDEFDKRMGYGKYKKTDNSKKLDGPGGVYKNLVKRLGEENLEESPAEMKKAALDVKKVYNGGGKPPHYVVVRGVTGLKAFDNEADARAHRDHLKRQEEMKEDLSEVSTEKLRDYASAALQDKNKAKADKRWKYAGKAMDKVADREVKAAHALKYNKTEEANLDEAESWEAGYKRRVVKTTKPEHKEKGYNWRIKGKERPEISIKLYKEKPSQEEFNKQMKRVAGHEFGG